MQVAIIKEGNAAMVSVNGESYLVTADAKLPATFHALQWDDTLLGARGELEHRMVTCEHCGARGKKPNEAVADLTPYQPLLDAWRVAKTAADLEKAKAAAHAPNS